MSLWGSAWLPHTHHKTPKRKLKPRCETAKLEQIYIKVTHEKRQHTCQQIYGDTLANQRTVQHTCETSATYTQKLWQHTCRLQFKFLHSDGATHLQLTPQVPALEIVWLIHNNHKINHNHKN